MKAYKVVIVITAIIAGWFWASWIYEIQQYRAETAAIHATLESRGLSDVRVYPKSDSCFTYNAKRGYQVVAGKVCIEDES